MKNVDLEQHRDMRKGARPEFVGERNPKTGEMGGPKIDPFKSTEGDWSYAGRVTVSATRGTRSGTDRDS